MEKRFTIEINLHHNFSIDEIWPEGDAPDDPTVEDVRALLFKEPHTHRACAAWGLEIRKEDIRITAHDPEEVRKLRQFAGALRAKELSIADLPLTCAGSEPVPLGPGKCPTPGCNNLEDGNCPTGQCMDCVTREYEREDNCLLTRG